MLRQKPTRFCRKTCWKEESFIFTVIEKIYIYIFFKHLYSLIVITEYVELNWLYKHTRKVRSSHTCTELSKTYFLLVSIVKSTKFQYIFYCKLWQSPRKLISVRVHLSKAAVFRSAALLGMSAYTVVLGSLLKCSELSILQSTSGWLIPLLFTFRKYFPSYIIPEGTILLG